MSIFTPELDTVFNKILLNCLMERTTEYANFASDLFGIAKKYA